MEDRKKDLYTAKVCRFCLSQDEPLSNLFEKKQAPKNSIPLSLKILSSINIEVFPSEKMPPYICRRCSFFMDIVYNFKNICREADKSILAFVQSGSSLEPVVWQPSLVKLFRFGAKPAPVNVVKVEGGPTVEVSQDMSDSEDDDENVYSVKIEDGSEEVASTCVKVVTSKETEKPAVKNKKECATEGTKTARARGDGCWACDECDCTYPLQQLLELHKMQKHRARDIACDICDAKFLTKNDLSTHMVRHSDKTPFECVACDKKFKRHILLKRHVKLMHSDLPQYKCEYCPASFLSEEYCEAHQTKHKRHGERRFACNHCDKRFFDLNALQKHIEVVHDTVPTHACEYCPERFTSISKLARHVKSHAGERPYPCKYCDKSFTKSHHYTRHLRVKHSDSAQPALAEEYRCDQCTTAFQSQDELIYHSAIHATQNLTCPLCQEKFDDVDAVTAHIKSHVTGMEFMCDFCELVFTSKEKLDSHIDNAHEDELRNAQDIGQDDTSMEMDGEEEYDDDDNNINLKDEGDHMVVEIKKPIEFMLSTTDIESRDETNITNSEESESEFLKLEPAMLELVQPPSPAPPAQLPPLTRAPPAPTAPVVTTKPDLVKNNTNNTLTANVLRKAEEIKRKRQESPTMEKKEKPKVESSTGGASDKSLRLLEKELQELQRTNKRDEMPRTPAKALDTRSRGRPTIHTSTPKLRSAEDKKSQIAKSTLIEKKAPERRAVKENKKPEDSKETKTNNVSANSKEEKEIKTKEDKETKTKEEKEAKDTKANVSKEESKDKSMVKNGGNNKSSSVEPVRRSTRPCKVKDYAKMVNRRPDETTPSDEDSDDDEDEEYVEAERAEIRPKPRRVSQKPITSKPQAGKPASATPAALAAAPKKRGRPRKDAVAAPEIPAKVKKPDNVESEDSKSEKMSEDSKSEKMDTEDSVSSALSKDQDEEEFKDSDSVQMEAPKTANVEPKPNVLLAPTGQTLKKVPIRALPPGVKPLPLPASARPIGTPEMCEMQIGKKMVKVQKIVMTKAEVDAMAKKGLLEMKDGTMVLKAGVKIPSDPNALKSTLVGEGERSKYYASKESPVKAAAAAPTRCDIDDS